MAEVQWRYLYARVPDYKEVHFPACPEPRVRVRPIRVRAATEVVVFMAGGGCGAGAMGVQVLWVSQSGGV
jgi:hypothetical protein